MITNECTGCGNTLTKSDEVCKYCGNKNPKYQKKLFTNLYSEKSNDDFSNNNKNTAKSSENLTVTNASTGKKLNVPMLIILLLFCQIGAIIYLIWFIVQ